MFKVGDWVEGDNGYGVIDKIIPVYYQYWDDNIPAGSGIGDLKQNNVIIKRFCSFDFKIRHQTQMNSTKFISKVKKSEMNKIKKILEDEKVSKKFEAYHIKNDIREVVNWDQYLSDKKINLIEKKINELKNNGCLHMTMKEVENYFKDEFTIDLIDKRRFNPNCYIQLISSGLGVYKNKELLFDEINIQRK